MKKLNLPIKEIYESYQVGISICKLSKLYNCSGATITSHLNKYCKENNLPLRINANDRGKKKLNLPIEEIYRMYMSGATGKSLAEMYGCNCRTLYLKMREYRKEHSLPVKGIIKILPAADIYTLYQAGYFTGEIATIYDSSSPTILKRLKEYCEENHLPLNLDERRNKIILPLERIYKLYQSGESYNSLGEKFDCSYRTIFRRLHQYSEENNLPLRDHTELHRRNLLDLPISEIYEMHRSGITQKKLAVLYNCSPNTISSRLHQYSEENNLPLKGSHRKKKCTQSFSNHPESINENNPNIGQFEKRKELLSQLKELLQQSREISKDNACTINSISNSIKKIMITRR